MSANRLLAVSLMACLGSVSCAHTPKEKIIQNIILAGVAGAAIGLQKTDYKTTYALMYGGLAASGAGIVSAYISDMDSETTKLIDDNKRMKAELDELQSPRVLVAAPATFSGRIPEKYRKLVNPGEWTVAEIDQWIDDGENRLIHQDKIMDLTPPSLQPINSPVRKGK